MKRTLKSFLLVFLTVIALIVTGCSKNDHVVSVELRDEGIQTEYHVGDELNLEGAKILIAYAFKDEVIDITKDMVEPYDFTRPGKKTIVAKITLANIEYKVTFEVEVLGDLVVTFDSEGGSHVEKQDLLKGDKATKPLDPTKVGYTFKGWYLEGKDEEFNFATELEESITLHARWEITVYDVTFDANGGSFKEGTTLTKGVKYLEKVGAVEAPTRKGHIFQGWYIDEEEFDFDETITEDKVIKAKWEKEVYTVTFNSNGGSPVNSQKVAYGDLVEEPDTPTLKGHDFVGWFLDGEAYQFDQPVEKNLDLQASWKKSKYTITFDARDGQFENGENKVTKEVEYEDLVPELEKAPTLEGYDFVGWYIGEEEYQFDQPVEKNLDLEAHWEKHTYTLTFDATIGSFKEGTTLTKEVKYLEEIGEVEAPTKTGYVFVGWAYKTQSDTTVDLTKVEVKADLEFVAIYELEKVTVSMSGTDQEKAIENNTVEREYVLDQKVVLTVTAAHTLLETGKVTYQWYKDITLLDAQTTASITLEDVSDSGRYYCVVTLTVGDYTTSTKTEVFDIIINRVKQEIIVEEKTIYLPAYEKYIMSSNGGKNPISLYTHLSYNARKIRASLNKTNNEQEIMYRYGDKEGKLKEFTLSGEGNYIITLYVTQSNNYEACEIEVTIVLYMIELHSKTSEAVKYYGSLTEAVADSQDGDTILIIGPTTLDEDIVLDKNQTLEIDYLVPETLTDFAPAISDWDGRTPSSQFPSDIACNTLKGSGTITVKSGATIVEPMFFIVNFENTEGSKFSELAKMLQDVNSIPSDFPFFPFNSYSLHSFQVKMIIEYNAIYRAKPVFGVNLMGETIALPFDTAKATVPDIVVPYVDENTTGLIALKEGATLTKEFIPSTQKNEMPQIKLTLDGEAITTKFNIKLELYEEFFRYANMVVPEIPSGISATLNIETLPFDIMSNVEFNLINNSKLTVNREINMLEGAIVNLEGTSTLEINHTFNGSVNMAEGTTVVIGESFAMVEEGSVVLKAKEGATVTNNSSAYTYDKNSLEGEDTYTFKPKEE